MRRSEYKSAGHCLRFYPFPQKRHISILIIPNEEQGNAWRDFILYNTKQDNPVFMFSCEAKTDTAAASLADANALDYIPVHWLRDE